MAAFVSVASLMVAVELTAPTGQKLSGRECWRIRRAKNGAVMLWRGIWCSLFHGFIVLAALLALFQTRHPGGNGMALLRLAAGVTFLYAALGRDRPAALNWSTDAFATWPGAGNSSSGNSFWNRARMVPAAVPLNCW
jgi:hypothetical protein